MRGTKNDHINHRNQLGLSLIHISFSVFAHNLGLDITPLRGDRVTPAAFSAVLAEAERLSLIHI